VTSRTLGLQSAFIRHLRIALILGQEKSMEQHRQRPFLDLGHSVLSWARMGGVDLSGFPHVDQWLAGCLKRPAAVKARPAPMAK
jgi:hypothetical protein